ncbi:hypothetical protein [Agrobacterium sp.]|uniref:hypothetical protein n=1 Tax=Agrobacterium sp. TaxID=361 RepID=UPI0028AD2F43|nr:hypothetical protein [Agrobacterium sp.]
MTGMLPVTEQLQECSNDAERAKWLLSVPTFIFYRDQDNIYRLLRSVRFMRGIELVSLELSGMLSTRDIDGRIPAEIAQAIDASRGFLKSLVKKGGLA